MKPEVIIEYEGYCGPTRLVQVPHASGVVGYVIETQDHDALGNAFWYEQGRLIKLSNGEVSNQLSNRLIYEAVHVLSDFYVYLQKGSR